jgi:hypothetical protein
LINEGAIQMQGDSERDEEIRDKFEEFTASPSWRSLPLKIKLMVVHIWRAERDVPAKK